MDNREWQRERKPGFSNPGFTDTNIRNKPECQMNQVPEPTNQGLEALVPNAAKPLGFETERRSRRDLTETHVNNQTGNASRT